MVRVSGNLPASGTSSALPSGPMCDPAEMLWDYLKRNPFSLPDGWVMAALDDVVYDDHQIIVYYDPDMVVDEPQQVQELLGVLTRLLTTLPVSRDVAIDIGMHESTVSRVVGNKYMHTPQGVFEMRYFFHSGIASVGGEHVSSVTIKQRIKKIVEDENPKRPLSDSKIVKILEEEGLVLARRTIAKYREELRIPPSNQRKNPYSSPFAS